MEWIRSGTIAHQRTHTAIASGGDRVWFVLPSVSFEAGQMYKRISSRVAFQVLGGKVPGPRVPQFGEHFIRSVAIAHQLPCTRGDWVWCMLLSVSFEA